MTARLLMLALGLTVVACNREGSTETEETEETEETGDTGSTTDCDSFAEACALAFDEQGVASDSNEIGEAEDRDFYAITATTGVYYAIHAMSYTVGEGEPDTVIRLYDSSETLLGENDDQPFRMNGTDAGYIFRAETDGTYYVEVLEWSDWDPTSTGADGDPSWEYDIVIYEMPINELVADNDTIAGADTALETIKDGDPANDQFFWFGDPWINENLFAVGDISSSTDVDLFGTWADNSDAGNYSGEVCLWGFYPDAPSDIVPVLTLYKQDGTQVAQTEAADITPDYKVFYDAGISFPIDASGGDYFLEVKDKNGGSGISYWYSLMHVCYPATFVSPPDPNYIQVSMETEGAENTLTMNQGTTAMFGRIAGFMNDGTGADTDTFKIIDGIAAGTKFSMWVDAVDAGSALLDAKFTILDSDMTTVLHTATAANPSIEELDISGTSGPIYIEMTSDSGLTGDDVYYMALVLVE